MLNEIQILGYFDLKVVRLSSHFIDLKIRLFELNFYICLVNNTQTMTQEDILPLVLKKDDKAFTTLYDMYSKSLFSVISNLINDQEEAEDILQEVFVKIWKNIDSYNESKGRFYTWIVNIARNASIDKLRSKGHNNKQKNLSSDNFVHLIDESNKLVNRIDTIGIQDFVKKLKPKCIQLIELLFFQGYTQQEASDELEIPLGTVKTQNRNCINDLRNYLKL
ncbi:MAG: RNA polymerase sigma-70 factor (ECF subfamily) [Flavobacterium sp.]